MPRSLPFPIFPARDISYLQLIVSVKTAVRYLEFKLDAGFSVKVKVKRRQIPLICQAASTLHVLQGCTCDPGLIFHWSFPRRLRGDMVWLAVYVALSRVRRLANFRSVGLTDKIRAVIEGGPPDSIPSMFEKSFSEKERKTKRDAAKYMKLLGWVVSSSDTGLRS